MIDAIADFRLPIENNLDQQGSNRQLAIGNRQCFGSDS